MALGIRGLSGRRPDPPPAVPPLAVPPLAGVARPAYVFLDHPGPLAFAHRGGSVDGLENTAVAFADALALGYGYLETDVRATADGALVAFHDRRLDRVTDATGAIEDLPWARVRRARVGGREPIPLLEDLLMAWPQARFNIDVKAAAAIGPLIRVIRRTRAQDRVCVASFSEARLAAVRRGLGAGVCTSLGPRAGARLWAAALAPRWPALTPYGTPCAQLPPHAGWLPVVTEALVETAHRAGMVVHAWTVDEPVQMHRLLDLGVDGLITDRPRVLREVLLARGQWVG
jgi:glycerophosphoryl diester phosphodiesterase